MRVILILMTIKSQIYNLKPDTVQDLDKYWLFVDIEPESCLHHNALYYTFNVMEARAITRFNTGNLIFKDYDPQHFR